MSEVGTPTRPHRSLWALARLPLHPTLSIALVALMVWMTNHVPGPRVSGPWPPGATRTGAGLFDGSTEYRTLAWAIRDGDAWRFVISPKPGEDDAAACTVDVVLEHGAIGYPYTTQIGWWSTRALSHRHQRLTAEDELAIYSAAAAFLRDQEAEPEAAFLPILEHPNRTEMYAVPGGFRRNTLYTVIVALGAVAAVRCAAFLFALLLRLIQWLDARQQARLAVRSYSCPACGYDLRGLPERRCPECGADWTTAPTATPSPAIAFDDPRPAERAASARPAQPALTLASGNRAEDDERHSD